MWYSNLRSPSAFFLNYITYARMLQHAIAMACSLFNQLLNRARRSYLKARHVQEICNFKLEIKRIQIRTFARFCRNRRSDDFSPKNVKFLFACKITTLCIFALQCFLIKIFPRKRVAACALSSRPFCLEVFALCRLLYVRNSFQSRESRKTLLHFPAALLNSPSRIPRENTHTLRRACAENARKKSASSISRLFIMHFEATLWIRFASRLFLDIIIPLFRGSASKSCNHIHNIKKAILSQLNSCGAINFWKTAKRNPENSLPLASQVFIIPGSSSFRDKS